MSAWRRQVGLAAEFDSVEDLVRAVRQARAAGYRRVDAYTPFPVEEIAEALDFRPRGVPIAVLVGGIVGGVSGYALQLWVSAAAYPINVGGRPFNSWPAFVPVVFETTVLFAALTALASMLIGNGLPMPYHPVFAVPDFDRVTRDGFFLCLGADDPLFGPATTRDFLETLGPRKVSDVQA